MYVYLFMYMYGVQFGAPIVGFSSFAFSEAVLAAALSVADDEAETSNFPAYYAASTAS